MALDELRCEIVNGLPVCPAYTEDGILVDKEIIDTYFHINREVKEKYRRQVSDMSQRRLTKIISIDNSFVGSVFLV